MNPTRPDDFDSIFDPRICSILDRLADDQIDVPESLESRILLSAKTPKHTVEGFLSEMVAEPPPSRRLLINRFADFLATAAAIILICSAVFLSSGYLRQQSRKALCAENLGVLGSAVSAYANDYYNQLPYAHSGSVGAWFDPATQRPNRTHLFVLVKGNYVLPQYLICPQECAKPDLVKIPNSTAMKDFPVGFVVSYSFQNLNGDSTFNSQLRQMRWSKAPIMAIMADRTPLLIKDQLKAHLDPNNEVSANHKGLQGQNILILDGRVTWQKTPFFGPQRDNIWQAGNIRQYNGKEIPADSLDCFLAP